MLKTYQKIRHIKPNIFNRFVLPLSTQPVVKETVDQNDQLKHFERISNIQRKIKTKQPQKPPFAKNFFLGKVDTDLLAYPELSNEDLDALNKQLTVAKAILNNEEVKKCDKFSKDFLQTLSRSELLGLQSSCLMGGKELGATELCRFIEEFSELPLKYNIIQSEVLGIQVLVKYANDNLKRKYLQRIIDGDLICAFCVLEPTKQVVTDIIAKKSTDRKSWVLNGQKSHVVNGSDADIYIVFAISDLMSKSEQKDPQLTAFVVERDAGGITSKRQNTVDGKSYLSHVEFNTTLVSSENLIGLENEAHQILNAIFPEYRLSIGPICSNLFKNLINNVVQHYLEISEATNLLYETDAIRIRLGELVTNLYAVDSMIYLTSGLIDKYENQDTELECAIVKVFASEQTFLASTLCHELIGPETCLTDHWCNKIHSEALTQVTLNINNDSLKILIALFGLSHAGQHLNDVVKQLRNPLHHLVANMRRAWTNRKHAGDDPALTLYLYQFLHPSSVLAAQQFEYCILRLQYATEIFLTHYGNEIVNQHEDLRRISESLIDIYAMTACLARASRSYCIGLQHADYEMTLAASFVKNATNRVKSKLNTVIEGACCTTDDNNRFVTERLFNAKKYYPVHPLTRNF